MKADNDPYQGLEELLLRRTGKRAKTKSRADRPTEESTGGSTPVSTDMPTAESSVVSTGEPGSQRTSEQAQQQLKDPTARSADQAATRSPQQDVDQQAPGQARRLGSAMAAAAAGEAGDYQLVRRSVSFYLTVGQSRALDILRQHLREAHHVATDRWALLRAVLEPPVLDFYQEENHDELIERLLTQLQRRFTAG